MKDMFTTGPQAPTTWRLVWGTRLALSLLTSLSAQAFSAPSALLGQPTLVEGSPLCPKNNCSRIGSSKLDAQTEFILYRLQVPGQFQAQKMFAFRVAGVNRMIGYYGKLEGSYDVFDPLQLSRSLITGLVNLTAGAAAVQPALQGIKVRQPYGQDTFEQEKAVTLSLPDNRVISNVTAMRPGSQPNGLSVTYVADRVTLNRLRSLINGTLPPTSKALSAAYQAAVKTLNLRIPCPYGGGVQVPDESNQAGWKALEAYFDARAMASNGGVLGEPIQLHLPGLSSSSLKIQIPFEDDSVAACLLKPEGVLP